MLAQQHAEHGGLGGVVPELLGEVQPGLVGVGAEQKPGLSPEQKHRLIPGGHLNFIDTVPQEPGSDLFYDCLKADGVQRHSYSSIIVPNSSLIRASRPWRYSHPKSASKAVAC